MYTDLDAETLAALRQFIHENGPSWKNALSADWMRGRLFGPLAQLRETHGWRWLARVEMREDRGMADA